MARRKADDAIDWVGARKRYSLGDTQAKICAEYGILKGSLSRKIKEEGWTRDKQAEVKQAMHTQLMLPAAKRNPERNSNETRMAEPSVLDIQNEGIHRANIVLQHRSDLGSARDIVVGLLNELKFQNDNMLLLNQLATAMDAPDKDAKILNEMFHKVISLGGRSANVKTLVDAMKNVITLERIAHGIDDSKGNEGSGELARIFGEVIDSGV